MSIVEHDHLVEEHAGLAHGDGRTHFETQVQVAQVASLVQVHPLLVTVGHLEIFHSCLEMELPNKKTSESINLLCRPSEKP